MALEKIKSFLFGEETISQEIVVQSMKKEIENLAYEYEKLVNIQDRIKENPRSILDMEFHKTEKYIDLMDSIKYKNINLIKEYELSAMKYNILIELYNKLKTYIHKTKGNIIIDFKTDKYKQPVAVLSPYEDGCHKIILIKNTFLEEDYLSYKLGENVEIRDLYSKEYHVNHGTFMVEGLFQTIETLKQKGTNVNKIIVSKELVKKLTNNNGEIFLKKQGFEMVNNVYERKI